MRHAFARDRNHPHLKAAFEAHDWLVFDVSDSRTLGLDFIVIRRGRVVAVEAKDGEKVPSARKLTPSEEKTRDRCRAHGVEWRLVMSVEDVRALSSVQP